MKRSQRYGIRSLEKDFPTEAACLDFIFDALHSRECSCGGTYKKIKGRKQYQCSKCRFQIAPLAGTIFHKSATPLQLWFKSILAFSNAKSGLSANELERELETTHKTAYRILAQIRKALAQGTHKLTGVVEIDTGYFGGRGYAGKNNENLGAVMEDKSIVVVAIQRGGEARAKIVPSSGTQAMHAFIEENIAPGTRILTDGSRVYESSQATHKRESVNHKQEYVRGDVHVNNVERFFSHLKRSIRGTHKTISKQHLQSYLDAFVFHYNNRHTDKERFAALLGTVLHAGG